MKYHRANRSTRRPCPMSGNMRAKNRGKVIAMKTVGTISSGSGSPNILTSLWKGLMGFGSSTLVGTL